MPIQSDLVRDISHEIKSWQILKRWKPEVNLDTLSHGAE